ncbi:MAG: alpha/beta fold hydrolase [Candidatus Aenigmatarchaeota archaeon]
MLMLNIEFCGNNKCVMDEIYVCNKDCVWCGDGKCQNDEIGSCYDDCVWCGDGYCQKSETCSSCSKDCGSCKAQAYCGDGVCNKGECETGCSKDCKISDCIDGKCDPKIGENCKTSSDCPCGSGEYCTDSGKCSGSYCGNGICDGSESKSSCPEDCGYIAFEEHEVNPNIDYPIIFVHGHSVLNEQISTYSINAFSEFQNKLTSYKDMGIILPNSDKSAFSQGEWGRYDKPISVRTTYYIGNLDSSGTFIRSDETERSINEYGERLGKVVDIVLHHTGKNKVIIIAHSMGGLVSRAYIKNYGGSSKVDKLITIGTPNHGIYGWLIGGLCENPLYGHQGQECKDMQHDSNFIANLNYGDETYGSTKYYTIAGFCNEGDTTEEDGDEVIRVSSVHLDGAVNKIVKRNGCISGSDTYHGYLISPSKVPEVYTWVKSFIE